MSANVPASNWLHESQDSIKRPENLNRQISIRCTRFEENKKSKCHHALTRKSEQTEGLRVDSTLDFTISHTDRKVDSALILP